ncbi:uncharacterized protein LOC126879855 isoform X2 [Diabrotica virgifera virgifera]|uniref:Uncharacterized protein n=1 Tax=Diabrotica virgifera virgifera TaxID=50390 RepID=A0ABM5JMH2_DIAVI|nr:uncharacterized protein LOC126879855 isoform X2 [Diabrotica virgifera virgifera]
MILDESQIEEQMQPACLGICDCNLRCCECYNTGLAMIEFERKDKRRKGMKKADEVDNFKIQLDKSLYVVSRDYYIKTCEVPSYKDAKRTLGNLATFVYNYCEPGLKPYIPSEPQMPYGDLWISPSDLLIPHVGLKAPLTRKHVQALTHEGILDIGYKIELQFIKELEERKQEALDHQKEELTTEFQESIHQIVKDAEAKERANCQRELTRMAEEFEQKLTDEITVLQADLETEFSTFSETHDAKIISTWEHKLHEAVEETTKNITKKFLDELAKQEQILIMHFKAQMAKLEMRRIYEREKMRHDHKKELQHAKHRLECRNLAHMMFILCMERRKCCEEKMAIEDYYKKKVEGLSTKIVDKKTNIKKLKKTVRKQMKDLQLRETCVLEILKQYQKFISFALRAAPTQAEFLLCIEKLMAFELTESQSKLKRISSEDSRLRGILPWPQTTPSYETIEENPQIVVEGHHPSIVTSTSKENKDMVLPVFGFQNNFYAREDFQNMPRDLKSPTRDDLWSEDVEFVLKTLRMSISSEKEIDNDPSSAPSDMLKKVSKGGDRSSTIQFKVTQSSNEKLIQVPSVEEVSNAISVEECESLKDRMDTKSSLKYTTPIINPVDHSQVGMVESNPLLLGTQSSLEMLAKKYNITLKQPDNITTIPEMKDVAEDCDPQAIEKFHRFSEKSRDTSVYIKSMESFRPNKESLTPKRTSTEDKTNQIAPPSTVSGKIPVETRDSFILRQSYLAKVQPRFSLSPNDSIEIKKDSSRHTLTKKKSSKLSLARDSVEMLRESRTLLTQPTVCHVCHKRASKEREIIVRKCDICCKNKDSVEVLSGGVIPKIIKTEDKENVASKIKVSHIEMIPVEEKGKHEVPFKTKPPAVDDLSYEKLNALYKQEGRRKSKVNTKRKFEDKCKKLKMSPKAKIAGDLKGIEHLQTAEEFTADRMKSFITILSNHPNLIKMFTACQR